MLPDLEEFKGVWRIRRVIHHQVEPVASFEGELRFEPDADGLIYIERGQLHMAGQPPMLAERTYLWRRSGSQSIAVHFADGRPFHSVSSDRLRDVHFCDPDTYEVAYDFSDWPHWQTEWQVTGPRKSYVVKSQFDRG